MINQQRIIAMTKLALYEKRDYAADRAANDYFRHDYIYKKNIGTRIAVGIAGLIILAVYWLRVILMDGVDVFQLYISDHLLDSILFMVLLLAVYSFIGTVHSTREYYLMQKRLAAAEQLLLSLNHPEGAPPQGQNRAPRAQGQKSQPQRRQPVIPPPEIDPRPQLRIRESAPRSRYTSSAIDKDA
jgi:hypothetical protein